MFVYSLFYNYFINLFFSVITVWCLVPINSSPTPDFDSHKLVPSVLIAHDEHCATDVQKLCSKVSNTNNFAVIDCLQSDNDKFEVISEDCQHLIWNYKRNLTKNYRFDSAASEVCAGTIEKVADCRVPSDSTGMVIPCLIEYMDNVTDVNCKAFLKRMRSVVFSDYRLIYKFADRCQLDINKYRCGRLQEQDDSVAPHNQGRTLRCLFEHYDNLTDTCQLEILRVAELQSDDYHSDRQLYYACRDDREKHCSNIKAGDGRIYRCLFRHKFARGMSPECRDMLVTRQQLAQRDYKVNLRVAKVCQKDINNYHCLNDVSQVAGLKIAQMSAILLCLEAAVKDDSAELEPDCVGELTEVRRSMMEDYRVNPLLIRDCSYEIKYCGGMKSQFDERILHCLMDLARPQHKKNIGKKIRSSSSCTRTLEEVLTEADVGENYEIDPVLHQVCERTVSSMCPNVIPGEGRVMNCLLSSMESVAMTAECKEGLMEVNYFISRDFSLDNRLYKYCHKDAQRTCSAPLHWHRSEGFAPALGPTILSCLYRIIAHISQEQRHLSEECEHEVRRVMNERAHMVDLDPQIEAGCLADLGLFCSDKTGKSQELDCLEDNLDEVSKNCRDAITKYSEEVDENPEISELFVHACKTFWNKYCQFAFDNNEEDRYGNTTGDAIIADSLMGCLIQYKHHPDMNMKCRAGIEHHQLVTLKDYHLSHQFKLACDRDILRLCPEKVKKSDVVHCLSDHVRNDALTNNDHHVSKLCRRQLRYELLQRSENIKLDPELEDACSVDVWQLCRLVHAGNAAVIECLRAHQKKLSDKCHAVIFKREQEEAADPAIDFLLASKCKEMIKMYCFEETNSAESMYECLKRNKEEDNFQKDCLNVIVLREQLHAKDIRLNRDLHSHCSADIRMLCSDEFKQAPTDKESDGKVILCLRKQYLQKKLAPLCESHIHKWIAESADNIKEIATLSDDCAEEIKKHCSDQIDMMGSSAAEDKGRVQQCLIEHVASKDITEKDNNKCFQQLTEILEETQFDINADAILYRACIDELKEHCSDIPTGEGRKMQCLLGALNSKKLDVYKDCGKQLTARLSVWKLVNMGRPAESLSEYAQLVSSSPSKHYFLTIFSLMFGVIFIGGLLCGRITKRVRRDLKSR